MCFNLKREISILTPVVGIVHGITLLFDKRRIMSLQYPMFQVAQKLLTFGPEVSVTNIVTVACAPNVLLRKLPLRFRFAFHGKTTQVAMDYCL
ncbi:hypothetical protein C8R48DRAFT_717836 [Suillus tomentosus]|nr:hypothetical protein C8R48DRAFT_717836 [Suillus tomentosus]